MHLAESNPCPFLLPEKAKLTARFPRDDVLSFRVEFRPANLHRCAASGGQTGKGGKEVGGQKSRDSSLPRRSLLSPGPRPHPRQKATGQLRGSKGLKHKAHFLSLSLFLWSAFPDSRRHQPGQEQRAAVTATLGRMSDG